MLREPFAQRVNFVDRSEEIVRHVMQQQPQPLRRERGPLQNQCLLLPLVLARRFGAKMALAKANQRSVVLEELRQVEILPTVKALLIEIHGVDPKLRLLKV